MVTYLEWMIRFINLILIGQLIFKKRKDPPLLLSWILVLMCIPIGGFILYLLFERTPRNQISLSFMDSLEQDLTKVCTTSQQSKSVQSLIAYNQNYNHSPLTGYNDLLLFFDGKSKYDHLFEDIQAATQSIHVLYFIIRNDEVGRRFIDLLAQKATEGLEVRVVYDSAGCFGTSLRFYEKIKQAGGTIHAFHPIKLRLTAMNYNYRNHRKIVVIDGRVGYMGGMNIGCEYMSLDSKFCPWRDAHLRIEGQAVRFLQLRFLRDYFMVCRNQEEQNQIQKKLMTYFPPPMLAKRCEVQIVSDGPDTPTDDIKSAMVKMIQIASDSIRIQTPYFIPDNIYLEALKMASYSGVKVELMIPTIADHHYVYRTTTSFIKELLDAGIQVYLYKGFLHSKIIIVDGKVGTLGSTNMDQRSFKINYEINAFIYDETFSQQLSTQFERDLKNCLLIDETYEESKPIWVRVEESFYRVVSMIL